LAQPPLYSSIRASHQPAYFNDLWDIPQQVHKLANKLSIIRFRIAALLLLVRMMLLLATFLVYALFFPTQRQDLAMIGLMLAGSIAVLLPIRLAIASECKCPLCRVPVLSIKRCSKNTNSKTFLGSYRLRIALQILFKNRFRCPYCNETTEIRSRR
jgi:hypothetical protein